MAAADIQPADVYARVGVLQYLVCALCALVVMQIVAKLFLFGRVVGLLEQADKLLRYSETHAAVTDSTGERMQRVITTKTEELKEVIPERAAAKTVERLRSDDSHHGG